jgi:hypothetical protein
MLIVLSVLVLMVCIPLLFAHVRTLVIAFAEQLVFHRSLTRIGIAKAHRALFFLGAAGLSIFAILDFFAIIPLGLSLLRKTGFLDLTEATFLKHIQSPFLAAAHNPFAVFAICSGLFVWFIALSRAANTGITYDEAFTYLNYVLPGFPKSLLANHLLNNHLLNSLLIQMSCFISQTRYNEFFIRLPNLLFYAIYILFAYRTAKESKNPFFMFVLFISNYYLNEFMGLARGYGMASSCVLIALYFFNQWKGKNGVNRHLHLCLLWCSLAALANGIALYTVFAILVLIIAKYRKNLFKLSYFPYFAVFGFVTLFTMYVSRRGYPIFSTGNIFSFVESIPRMFIDLAGGGGHTGARRCRYTAYSFYLFVYCKQGQK